MVAYILAILASFLLSCQTGVSKAYSAKYGNSMRGIYQFSTVTGFIFVFMMIIKNIITGDNLSVTVFSLIIAFVLALLNAVGIIFLFAAFRYGVVSVNVLFAKLGTLLLPTIFGFLFQNEAITLGKVICVGLVIAALITTIDFKEKGSSKKAYIYYFGLFIVNGLAGIMMSIHQKVNRYPKVSENNLTTLLMLCYGIICLTVVIFFRIKDGKGEKIENKPLFLLLSSGNGLLFGMATIFNVIALTSIPSSVQYPLSSGLGIFFGGVVGLFFKEKITPRFLISTFFVVLGTIALSL